MVHFGQLVLGPPGSGKTTYCEGMRQLLQGLGRPVMSINLDFSNDNINADIQAIARNKDVPPALTFQPPDIDVRDLIRIEDVMEEFSLGPNGGLLYCLDHLLQNVSWLIDSIKRKTKELKRNRSDHDPYLLIDMPGQVELYTSGDLMVRLLNELSKDRNVMLAAIHIVDSTLCFQPDHYLSAILVSLSAQIGLELPFINVLSKADLFIKNENQSNFSLQYFSEGYDLDFLLPSVHPKLVHSKGDAKERQYASFHSSIIELVEDYNLVSSVPLDVENKKSMLNVLRLADVSNGFAHSGQQPSSTFQPDGSMRPDLVVHPILGATGYLECQNAVADIYARFSFESNNPDADECK